jgi:hypothetical protein
VIAKCERVVGERRCGAPAVAFVMGQTVCVVHDTTGSPACTHSLAPSGRCAYCGAVTPS